MAPWMSDPVIMLPASTSNTKFPCSHLNWYFFPTVISGPYHDFMVPDLLVIPIASSWSVMRLSPLALILSTSSPLSATCLKNSSLIVSILCFKASSFSYWSFSLSAFFLSLTAASPASFLAISRFFSLLNSLSKIWPMTSFSLLVVS